MLYDRNANITEQMEYLIEVGLFSMDHKGERL